MGFERFTSCNESSYQGRFGMKRWSLLSLIVLLAACGNSNSNKPGPEIELDAGPSQSHLIEDQILAWQEIQSALRASPGHRTAEAQRLILQADPAAIFSFVRDHIGIRAAGNTSLSTQMLWGAKAALRGGVGTPRERAELLKWMLEEAGFEAEMRSGAMRTDAAALLAGLFQRAKTDVPLPTLTPEQLTRWGALYRNPIDTSVGRPIADEGFAESAALATKLRPMLTDPTTPYRVSFSAAILPFVRYRQGTGEWTNANPNMLDAELGQAYVIGDNGSAAPGAAAISESVKVRVWARKNAGVDRTEDIEIFEKSWSIDQAIGRTATLRFDPLLSIEDLLPQIPQDLVTFFPTLKLVGTNDEIDGEVEGATGPVLSLLGQKIELIDDAIAIDGDLSDLITSAVPDIAASVRSIEAETDSSGFPLVKVRFDALDSDGNRVAGMLGGDLEVTENGKAVVPLLRRNTFRPRVVFAIDNSSSVPLEFRDGFKDLVLDLAGSLFSSYDARVMASAVGNSDNSNPFVSDLVALADQIDNDVLGVSSGIWGEVAAMSNIDASLIVLITDADNTAPDEIMTQQMEQQIRSGPAVLVLGAGTVYSPSIERLAELTPTTSIPVDNVIAASQAVLAYVADNRVDYELQYQAPQGEPALRDVKVALRNGVADGTSSYTADPLGAAARGLVGLYLSVEYDGRTHTRTLAGIAPNASVDLAGQEDLDEVQGAFFGQYALTFEGGFLSPAMVYDELLTRRLAKADLMRAFGDDEALAIALNEGSESTNELAGFYLATTVSGSNDSVPMGLRAMLYVERPNFGLGSEYREMDLLPFGEWATAHEDPQEGWNQTFERSLHLAVVEAANFPVNTRVLLENETLIEVPAESVGSRVNPDMRDAWNRATRAFRFNYTVLMPEDGEPLAFWAVHKKTGFVIGGLSEGGGAGRYAGQIAMLEERLAYYERTLAMIRALNSIPVIGAVWMQLEYEKAKFITQAAIAILSLDSDAPPFEPGPALRNAGCSVLEQGVGGVAGAVSPAFGRLDQVSNAVNGIQGEPVVPSVCGALLAD